MLIDEATKQRFWAKVDIKGEDDCWLWQGGKSRTGSTYSGSWTPPRYSELSNKATKAAYQIANGVTPKDTRIAHTCTNSLCCNPKHLTCATPLERFWEKVDRETPGQGIGDCWLWKDALTTSGYGQYRIDPKQGHQSASRIAYVLTYGEIPKDVFVCHKCDVRACCRPSHLFIGNQSDNLIDMVMKKRGPGGEKHHEAKLTESDVIKIKQLVDDGVAQHVIAKQFNVTQACISRINTGQGWKHLNKKEYVNRTLSRQQEEEAIRLLAQGVKQKEIASKFNISQATVSNIKKSNQAVIDKMRSQI